MKQALLKITSFVLIATNIFVALFFSTASVQAAINKQINYQGRLTTSSNVAVTNAAYSVRFKLYTAPTGGSPLWTEAWCYSPDGGTTCNGSGSDNRVTITDGLFSVLLGSTTALTGVDFNQTLYLGVEIGGSSASSSWDGEMTPRKKLGAVPAAIYSENAGTVGGVASSSFFRSDTTNSTSTATTFMSVVQSGAGKIAEFFSGTVSSVLSLLSNGSVGVGTTTPGSTFAIQGTTSAATRPLLTVASSSGAQFLTVTSGGNVGIGSSSPAYKLTVDGGAYISSGNSLTLDTAASGLKTISASGNDVNVGGAHIISAFGLWTRGTRSTGIDATGAGGDLTLYAGGAEKMRLTTTGNFGIGTTTPATLLSVYGTTPTISVRGSSTASAKIDLAGTYTTWSLENQYVGGETNDMFRIYNSALGANALTINRSTNNVGIGTTTPTNKLHIDGASALRLTNGIPGIEFLQSNATTWGLYNVGTNANFAFIGQNVGIGTTTPGQKLVVDGNIIPALTNTNSLGLTSNIFSKTWTREVGNNTGELYFNDGNSSARMTSGVWEFGTRNLNQIVNISLSGSVVTASTTATSTFFAASTTNFAINGRLSDALNSAGTLGMVLQTTGTSTKWVATSTLGITGTGNAAFTIGNGFIYNATSTDLVAIGSTTAIATLNVKGKGGTSPFIVASSTGAQLLTLLQNGNFGVGTAAPSVALDVVGQGKFSSAGTIPVIFDGTGQSFNQFTVGGVTKGYVGWTSLGDDGLVFLASNGSTANLLVTDAGNVGIGTTTPGAKLDVNGTVQAGNYIATSTTATSTFAGAVGIGTTTPIAKLDVEVGNNTFPALFLGSGTAGLGYSFNRNNGTGFLDITANQGSSFGLNVNGGASFTSYPTVNGNALISQWGSTLGIGTGSGTASSSLQITGGTQDIRIGGGMGFDYRLYRDSGTGFFNFDSSQGGSVVGYLFRKSGVEQMRLDSNGNLGIGTSSPAQKLDVNGTVQAGNFIATSTTATSTFFAASTTNFAINGRLSDATNSAGTLGMVLQTTGTSTRWVATSTLGGVSSVSNSDGTLTISPTTGSVVASINQASDFSWTGQHQLVGSYDGDCILCVYNQSNDGGSIGLSLIAPGDGGDKSALTIKGNSGALNILDVKNSGDIFSSRIYPLTDSTFDLGSTASRWYEIFGDIVTVGKVVADDAALNSTFAGRVGVGITSPGTKLDVNGDVRAGNFIGTSTTATSTFFAASTTNFAINGRLSDTTNSAGTLGMVLQTTGTSTKWVATSTLGITGTGNAAFTIGNGFIYNATSTDRVAIGSTTAIATLNVRGSAAVNPFIVASSTGAELFSIMANGNVGIGSSSPAYRLTIEGRDLSINSDSSSNIFLQPRGTGGRNFRIISGDSGTLSGTYGNKFGIVDETAGSIGRLVIDSTGNVGIGITSPSAKLHVNGDVLAANYVGTSTTATSTFFAASTTNFAINGRLSDTTNSAGTLGMVLQTTGTSTKWVATSTLGITGTGNSAFTIGNGFIYNATTTDEVAIGSTTAIATLNVRGSAAVNPFIVASSTGAELFSIMANGNVGINETVPLAKLDVRTSGAGSTALILDQENAADRIWLAYKYSDGAGTYGDVRIKSGAIVQTTSAVDNYSIRPSSDSNQFNFLGNSGQPYLQVTNGTIIGFVGHANNTDGIVLGSSSDHPNTFRQNNVNIARMSASGGFAFGNTYYSTDPGLNNTIFEGNVGIGTTSPGTKLDVNGDVRAGNFIGTSTTATSTFFAASTTNFAINGRLSDTTNSAGTLGMVLQTTGTSTKWVATSTLGITGTGNSAFTIGNGFIYNATTTDEVAIGSTTAIATLNVRGSAAVNPFIVASSTGTQLFSILANGNVGIGTNAPGTLLDVRGTSNFTGTSTFAAPIRLGVGTVSEPSISFSSFSNIGFYIPTTGQMGVSIGGTERMRFASGGNVGIGTSSPGAKLDVNGTVQAGNFIATSTTASTLPYASTTGITVSGKAFFSASGYDLGTVRVTNVNTDFIIGSDSATAKFRLLPYGSDIYFDNTVTGSTYFRNNSDGTPKTLFTLTDVNGILPYASTTGLTVGDKAFFSPSGYNLGTVRVTNANTDFIIGADGATAKFRLLPYGSDIYFDNTVTGNTIFRNNESGSVLELARFNSTGSLGIGETTPGSKLSVSGNATIGAGYDTLAAPTNGMIIEGMLGIGSTTPVARLAVQGVSGSTTSLFAVASSTGTQFLTVLPSGNVGVGSSTPTKTFSVNGTVAFNGLSASAGDAVCIVTATKEITTNTGATSCAVSSQKYKHDIQDLNVGLNEVMKLRPVSYEYNGTNGRRVGFIAEEINLIDTRFVFNETDGTPRGVRYEEITSLLTKAIQEQQKEIETLKVTISGNITAAVVNSFTSFGAEISNGFMKVVNLVADSITTKKLKVEEGISVKDKTTGSYYCIIVENGSMKSIPGECASSPVVVAPPPSGGLPPNEIVISQDTSATSTDSGTGTSTITVTSDSTIITTSEPSTEPAPVQVTPVAEAIPPVTPPVVEPTPLVETAPPAEVTPPPAVNPEPAQ